MITYVGFYFNLLFSFRNQNQQIFVHLCGVARQDLEASCQGVTRFSQKYNCNKMYPSYVTLNLFLFKLFLLLVCSSVFLFKLILLLVCSSVFSSGSILFLGCVTQHLVISSDSE